MIISDPQKLVFVHIPKNGGTSIRQQLAPFDSYGGKFYGSVFDGEGRQREYAHLPLAYLQELHPEIVEKIKTYNSFAILREPHDRFFSSMREYYKRHGTIRFADLDRTQIVDAARWILDRLMSHPGEPEFTLAHFQRQSDFVMLNGEKYVKNLFIMNRMSEAFGFAETHLGTRLAPDLRQNEGTSIRFGRIEKPMRAVSLQLYSVLPGTIYKPLRSTARSLVFRKSRPGAQPGRDEAPDLDALIDAYYAEDVRLYRDSLAGAEARAATA